MDERELQQLNVEVMGSAWDIWQLLDDCNAWKSGVILPKRARERMQELINRLAHDVAILIYISEKQDIDI